MTTSELRLDDDPVVLPLGETVRVLRSVVAPLVAQGAVVRRPRMTAWAERRQTDREAGDVLAALRERYDGAPLVLRVGPRTMVLVTSPEHVRRLLEETPDPFTPASREKRGALAHFQPGGVLVCDPEERPARRGLNEAALDAAHAVHQDGASLVAAAARGTTELVERTRVTGELDADGFAATWWQIVLEVVFGERARGDLRLIDMLDALRRDANWSGLMPRRTHRRALLRRRIAEHVSQAGPGSLAALARDLDGEAVVDQVAHWLFAFDAAGATTLRALAVATARDDVRRRLRDELDAAPPGRSPALLPYARGCVLEAVRLWPTTFAILRDAVRPTRWGGTTVPAGTGFVVVSSFFHRDRRRLEFADRFVPEAWLDGRADEDWGLVPFSGGPASCPGRNVVLLVASHALVRLAALDVRVDHGEVLAQDPVPATLDHLGRRFRRYP